MPLARPGDGLPQSYLAISKDVHRPSRARHRDIKLCLVRLAERPNWHAGNDLVDSLRLAGVTGDSDSLVEMQSGPIANNLAFIEYDLAVTEVAAKKEIVGRRKGYSFVGFRLPQDLPLVWTNFTARVSSS
jgi:hypothetical protein